MCGQAGQSRSPTGYVRSSGFAAVAHAQQTLPSHHVLISPADTLSCFFAPTFLQPQN